MITSKSSNVGMARFISKFAKFETKESVSIMLDVKQNHSKELEM